MRVTVDVAGGPKEEFALEEGATYGDLLDEAGYDVHRVSVLVDGRPVPEDAPVDAERVRVVRLVKGG